ASPQKINRALGFAWPDAPAAAAPQSRAVLLVFVRTGAVRREVVREIHYDGGEVGLGCLAGRSFTHSDAGFRVDASLVAPTYTYERALVPLSGAAPTCFGAQTHGP